MLVPFYPSTMLKTAFPVTEIAVTSRSASLSVKTLLPSPTKAPPIPTAMADSPVFLSPDCCIYSSPPFCLSSLILGLFSGFHVILTHFLLPCLQVFARPHCSRNSTARDTVSIFRPVSSAMLDR